MCMSPQVLSKRKQNVQDLITYRRLYCFPAWIWKDHNSRHRRTEHLAYPGFSSISRISGERDSLHSTMTEVREAHRMTLKMTSRTSSSSGTAAIAHAWRKTIDHVSVPNIIVVEWEEPTPELNRHMFRYLLQIFEFVDSVTTSKSYVRYASCKEMSLSDFYHTKHATIFILTSIDDPYLFHKLSARSSFLLIDPGWLIPVFCWYQPEVDWSVS